MITLLIAGAGTGVGKTRAAAALARVAAQRGRTVQIIKPVQTGLAPGEPSDAETAALLAGLASACAHTLRRYPAALAPLAAATAAGAALNCDDLLSEVRQLPEPDVRLVEGAGGVAVPLTEAGLDWAHFAKMLGVAGLVLVVADELGAINQARLVYHYALSHGGTGLNAGIFLNALVPPPPTVAAATRAALTACRVPLWGELAAGALAPALHAPLADWVGA